MILYTTSVGPHIVAWTGTQADARASSKTLEPTYRDVGWEEHQVPVDKPGLISWLNKHAVQPMGDNLGEYLVKRSAETPHLPKPPPITPQEASNWLVNLPNQQ